MQYRKYEKNMLPKHNQGAQMHSMHGRQNFEAYWNFSLTFPEVLALLLQSLLLLLLLLCRPNRTRGSCEETCAPNTLTRCLMYTFFYGARAYKCHPAAAAVRSYDSRLCISVDISNIGTTMEVRRAINIIYTCVYAMESF